MLYSDIKNLSVAELMQKKKELRSSAFDARMKNSMGQLPNPMTIRSARRDVARLNTALTANSGKLSSVGVSVKPAAEAVSAAKAPKKKAAVKKAKA